MSVSLRRYQTDDAAPLFAIYVEAVRIGAAAHYTQAQRLAWVPDDAMPAGWPDKLAAQETWVAETADGIVGFMSITTGSHIDLAFVRPGWMGRGVAQALYERVVERARNTDQNRLTTQASHLARRFFARNCWRVDATEIVDRNGEVLTRFAMSLDLKEPA